jgi:hypothetical protein
MAHPADRTSAYDPVMFRHVVLLTFTDEATDDRVDQVISELHSLPSEIPEIRGYQVGRDAGLAEGNSHVVVVADFDDRDGYLVYRDHPAHQRVIAERVRPMLASRAAIQHPV